ncbi:hypothetical protein AB0H37_08185 [Actinomadura sp. NPDC023710]|uniref:NACHT domain-containing protein n=1 Tax=Actinomadura sp. NPDC023710 TaxID=3158219 RepID=UPI0033DFB45A
MTTTLFGPVGREGTLRTTDTAPKARIFFAAHATRGETEKRTKNKITDDLTGCLKSHRDVLIWRYLTNDTLTGSVDQYIDNELRAAHPDVTIEIWGPKRLANEILKLAPDKIDHVLQLSLHSGIGESRRDFLLGEASLCKGRLLSRWLATGLSEKAATELAEDEEIGAWREFEAEFPNPRLAFIVGEFGSGKSITALRIHYRGIQAALIDQNARLPIFLPVREMGPSLGDKIREIIDRCPGSRTTGIKLIIDGLEELGLGAAAALLDQIRAFALSDSINQVIVTTRPGPNLANDDVFQHPKLTEDRAAGLVERLGGHRGILWNESSTIREMLRLPLFLIIAATRQQGGGPIPHSRGAFLNALAREVLGPPSFRTVETENALKDIARLSMDYRGSVPLGELENDLYLPDVLATRFVVQQGGTIAFALPILQQYFAARSVLESGFEATDLRDLTLMDRWRYALLLAISGGSWRQVNSLLEQLVAHVPGLASWLIRNAIPSTGESSSVSLPNDLKYARRIRDSLTSWTAIFKFPDMLGFVDEQGIVNTVGTSISENRVLVGLRPGGRQEEVANLPPNFTAPQVDGLRWSPVQMSEIQPDLVAWPWRFALDFISADLEILLKARVLPLPHCPAYVREREWMLARAIMGRQDVLHRPIPRRSLVASARNLIGFLADNEIDVYTLQGYRPFVGSKEELGAFIEKLDTLDVEFIERPYIAPDNLQDRTGTIAGLYSMQAINLLVAEVMKSALEIYSSLVDTYFSSFKSTLGLACIMPLKVAGTVRDIRNNYIKWSLAYSIEPTADEANVVQISIKDDMHQTIKTKERVFEEHDRIFSLIRALHPNSVRWARPRTGSMAISMFKDMPATALAYRWLWEDLKELSVVTSSPPYRED